MKKLLLLITLALAAVLISACKLEYESEKQITTGYFSTWSIHSAELADGRKVKYGGSKPTPAWGCSTIEIREYKPSFTEHALGGDSYAVRKKALKDAVNIKQANYLFIRMPDQKSLNGIRMNRANPYVTFYQCDQVNPKKKKKK